MQAALLAVFGHERDAKAIGIGRRLDVDGCAIDRNIAATPAACDTKDGFQDLGAARAEQAADPQDFTSPKLEANAVQRPQPSATVEGVERQVPHREHGRADLGNCAAVARCHFSADHRRNKGAAREFGDRGGQDASAVAQHRHPIGEIENLFDAVRGVDDRDSVAGELPCDLEKRLAFR
jgi:hypothetical protein